MSYNESMDKPISKQVLETALSLLDQKLTERLTLLLGGGGCMILAHNYPLATTDVDALPLQLSFETIDPLVKSIAKEAHLPGDWLNPYFATFTHVLPPDYKDRLIAVFSGKKLTVNALGKEDMLIMKCFAHRPKDLGHARALIKGGADIAFVEKIIESHAANGLPEASKALDFLDELKEEFGT